MLLAFYSHTPLAALMAMTFRQLSQFIRALPEVARITSPFGGDRKDEAITDPRAILQLGHSLGLVKR